MSTPTDAELQRAIRKIDLLLKQRQARWEVPRALVLWALAVAALLAASGLMQHWFPPPPQHITATIHIDQPLTVKVVPP